MNSSLTAMTGVNFHPLHDQAMQTMQQLRSAEQNDAVRTATARIEQFITDIRSICYPAMDLPVSVR
jgi:hypothetical protein